MVLMDWGVYQEPAREAQSQPQEGGTAYQERRCHVNPK